MCICIFGQWLVKRRPAKWAFIALSCGIGAVCAVLSGMERRYGKQGHRR
ncbi:MAG: hypothetical protein ACLT0Y_05855 [Christensenellales bacterium]